MAIPLKTASSQAAWALLTEGVTRSRLEVHRIQLLLERAHKLVEESDHKEHIYQVAGDILQSIPQRMSSLEVALDRTSLALAKMGEEFFDSRLPLSEKTLVDEAIEAAFGASRAKQSGVVARVAERFLQSDLNPPLGKPGGPCHVVRRIDQEVRNPGVKDDLIDDVEVGETLSNQAASLVYGPEIEIAGGLFRRMQLSSHAQYRMDLRGITVALIQRSLADLSAEMQRDPDLTRRVYFSGGYRWMDPKRGVTIVIDPAGRDMVKIITVFPTGVPDPRPPGEGGCGL